MVMFYFLTKIINYTFSGTTLVGYIVYWTVGLVYTFFDVTNWPKFIHRYKIQPGTNEPADPWKVFKVKVY